MAPDDMLTYLDIHQINYEFNGLDGESTFVCQIPKGCYLNFLKDLEYSLTVTTGTPIPDSLKLWGFGEDCYILRSSISMRVDGKFSAY